MSFVLKIIAICFFVVLVPIIVLSRFVKRDNQVKIPLSLCVYPFSVLLTLIVLWYVCTKGGVDEKGQFALAIVILLLFVPMVFLFFAYQRSFEKENEILKLKSEMESIKILLNMR